jgi:hypothetical protein
MLFADYKINFFLIPTIDNLGLTKQSQRQVFKQLSIYLCDI